MNTHPNIQRRDLEILRRLARCYRITTAEIEAEHYGISQSTMRKRLNVLTAAKLVCRLTAWCAMGMEVSDPLFSWRPGEPEPDYEVISHQARTRWRSIPVREKSVFCISNRALNYFGLPPRKHLKLTQATHDLGVNLCYWYARVRWPDLEFIGEDLFSPLRGHGEGVEDAQLVDSKQRIVCCIEHVGAYRADRVAHFHQHVGAERNLPYFLF
ncbi:winged helix-turn-helix domain-containing protein [Rhodopirellula sp. JC639]|uniref:winged helix-turn-helix domain-containing protein n=1 Tax=Stieleria mannarensis TaxID=2755585 RepID=UPI0015FFABA3|nr:winged helix-turn-helix domain-containing protein [Rhodopirellula sp. JC639]